MAFLSPRIAPGIGAAMARVAVRFYFFSILLVGFTIYLPHPFSAGRVPLSLLALLSLGIIVLFRFFPWDSYEPRVFTLIHLLLSSLVLSLLVYFTGGMQSSYDLLFFLIILFSYFYNLAEMLSITTAVSLFYLLPYLYDRPQPHHFTTSAVTVLFFYLGTYILYGVTRFVLKKNGALQELNRKLSGLYSVTSDLLRDMEQEAHLEALSERLKDHIPATYCVVMLLDDKLNLATRIACPVRSLAWEPATGSVYPPARLTLTRDVLETRQPKVYRLEFDEIDDDLRKIVTAKTRTVLVVPIRVAAENVGLIIFGEERRWEREPITNDKIQLAVAISRQVAVALNMRWSYERLTAAQHEIRVTHDKMIKAERLAAIGEVIRAVEHEINNPLSVILNWAEVYREDGSIDPEVRKKFQIIYDMTIRIRDAVRKLRESKEARSAEFFKDYKMPGIEEEP